MPEVSDLVVGVAPMLAAVALLRALLCGRGAGAPPDSRPLPGEAAELRRIRADVHDHTVQRLAALAWEVDLIPGEEGTGLAAEARAVLDELRDIVLGQAPVAPDGLDLLGTLRHLEDERGPDVPPIHLVLLDETGGRASEVPREVVEHALLVAREALGNAMRHGSAMAVTVEASLGVDRLHLEVRDDGRGIDPARMAHARAHAHGGLGAMQARATAIGARLVIESSARGTRVALDWRR